MEWCVSCPSTQLLLYRHYLSSPNEDYQDRVFDLVLHQHEIEQLVPSPGMVVENENRVVEAIEAMT